MKTLTTIILTALVFVEGNLEISFNTLGWKRIFVTSNSKAKKDIINMSKNGFYVSVGDNLCSKATTERFKTGLDGTATEMTTYNETLLARVMHCGKSEMYRNLIIVTTDTLDKVSSSLAMKKESIGLIGLLMPQMHLLRIIKMTFSKNTIVMPYLTTDFDFYGFQMECYNLPWSPVIDYDCKEKNCHVSGTYPKLISRIGKKYNFTTSYHLDPSGKWGSTSSLGGNASSVLNTLHAGNSAFSFSWIGTYERVKSFDHVTGIPVTLYLYMMDGGSGVSWDMVTLPFSVLAWTCIIVLVCTVAFGHKIISVDYLMNTSNNSRYAMKLFFGIFLTIIISFYDGAMVIALTRRQPPPFEDLNDGLAHTISQDWNLVYSKGTEGLYREYYARLPGGREKSDSVLNKNYKYALKSRIERFQHLTNTKTFLLDDKDRAANFLRNTKCQACKNSIRFGRPERRNSGFLFEKNSPLSEVFKIGMIHMREMGNLDNVQQSLGPEYKPIATLTASPITIQLTALLFLYLGLMVFIICPLVFMFEHLFQRVKPKFWSNKEVTSCKRTYEEGICAQCGQQQMRLVCLQRNVMMERLLHTK